MASSLNVVSGLIKDTMRHKEGGWSTRYLQLQVGDEIPDFSAYGGVRIYG